jgi:hypothetical protein
VTLTSAENYPVYTDGEPWEDYSNGMVETWLWRSRDARKDAKLGTRPMRNENEDWAYGCLNAVVTQPKMFPFWVVIAIELKNIQSTSDNKGIWRGVFRLTNVPVLSDVVGVLFNSVVVLIPFGHFLCCAAIAFSDRYIVWYEWKKIWKDEIADEEITE